MKTYVDANLSSVNGTARWVWLNFGANDVGSMPAEATWKANMTSIINSVRAKWPGVKVFITRPWRRNFATECNTLASWITDICALYASDVVVGDDERIWLENGDNGTTRTDDGIHPNAGAQSIEAAVKIAVMSY